MTVGRKTPMLIIIGQYWALWSSYGFAFLGLETFFCWGGSGMCRSLCISGCAGSSWMISSWTISSSSVWRAGSLGTSGGKIWWVTCHRSARAKIFEKIVRFGVSRGLWLKLLHRALRLCRPKWPFAGLDRAHSGVHCSPRYIAAYKFRGKKATAWGKLYSCRIMWRPSHNSLQYKVKSPNKNRVVQHW